MDAGDMELASSLFGEMTDAEQREAQNEYAAARSALDKKYAARNNGVMRIFNTEDGAFIFAEKDSAIALYSEDKDGKHFTFIRIVGVKSNAETIASLMQR